MGCYVSAMTTQRLTPTSTYTLTHVLGRGAFRTCLATTDPTVAVKVGQDNRSELANWQDITADGSISHLDGFHIPWLRWIEPEELAFHPEHLMDDDEVLWVQRDLVAGSAMAIERVPGGRHLTDVVEHYWTDQKCSQIGPCGLGECVYRRARRAFGHIVGDLHGRNLMVASDGVVWLVDMNC